jgi:hypothetical protein
MSQRNLSVQAPTEADLRPGATPAGMVVFAYEYGTASRYFYAPPWYATVTPQPLRAGEARAPAPLE